MIHSKLSHFKKLLPLCFSSSKRSSAPQIPVSPRKSRRQRPPEKHVIQQCLAKPLNAFDVRSSISERQQNSMWKKGKRSIPKIWVSKWISLPRSAAPLTPYKRWSIKDEKMSSEEGDGIRLPDKCQSLRQRSIRKRIETEKNKHLPKPRKQREKPAPLSKYRRKTANARERQRMHEVNQAFDKLKASIPHHKLNQVGKKTILFRVEMIMQFTPFSCLNWASKQ